MEIASKLSNVMIDIETMGISPNAAIIGIAAVEFGQDGSKGAEFYANVDLKSSCDIGLQIDADTALWWMKQKPEARSQFFQRSKHIVTALSHFSGFIKELGEDVLIWSNSPSFDCVILKNALKKAGFKTPWEYHNERDFRTAINMLPEIKQIFNRDNYVPHHPLSDCHYQIDLLAELFRSLKGNIRQE